MIALSARLSNRLSLLSVRKDVLAAIRIDLVPLVIETELLEKALDRLEMAKWRRAKEASKL